MLIHLLCSFCILTKALKELFNKLTLKEEISREETIVIRPDRKIYEISGEFIFAVEAFLRILWELIFADRVKRNRQTFK